MERANTKIEILKAALDLFSTQGFEATSISQIAEAVGIRKASLYSHFESKQAILDALVNDVLKQYETRSIFALSDWNTSAFTSDGRRMNADEAAKMIREHLSYIIHDAYISKARKMLVIEQFQNPELAKLQTKQNYTDVMNHFQSLVKQLIGCGVLTDDDPEIMAAQLCLPITVWINLCDREPEREPEVMELVERHIRQFFRLYSTNENYKR